MPTRGSGKVLQAPPAGPSGAIAKLNFVIYECRSNLVVYFSLNFLQLFYTDYTVMLIIKSGRKQIMNTQYADSRTAL